MRGFAIASVALLLAATALARKAPTRPSIYGIAYVRLHSTKLETSVPFFQSILGLIPADEMRIDKASTPADERFRNSKLRSLHVGGLQIVQLDPLESGLPRNFVEEVGFLTSDVAAMRKYLLSQGLHPGPIEIDGRFSPAVTISDAEGHSIAFVQRPKAYLMDHDRSVSKHLIHAGFVVRDRAAEDHFYKGILGFRPYWHGGMKDGESDWVSLQVPDGTDWLEFMINVSPTADHHTLGVMNHIALGVPDIHAAEAQLHKNGWSASEQPKIGRDGKWQLNLYDPDDTRVELMEFTPVQKPCCSEYTGSHPKP